MSSEDKMAQIAKELKEKEEHPITNDLQPDLAAKWACNITGLHVFSEAMEELEKAFSRAHFVNEWVIGKMVSGILSPYVSNSEPLYGVPCVTYTARDIAVSAANDFKATAIPVLAWFGLGAEVRFMVDADDLKSVMCVVDAWDLRIGKEKGTQSYNYPITLK